MARTISTPYAGTFVLSLTDPDASGGSDDPLTVTSTITATTGDGSDGASTTAWVIFNTGTVAGENNGIALAGEGGIANTGLISAVNFDGVTIGGLGVVDNSGTIEAGNAGFPSEPTGVAIGGVGLVFNQGTILGVAGGVAIAGAGYVRNTGSISAEFLSAAVGIGGAGEVINSSTIYGQDTSGVTIDAGGLVTNDAGALIFGHSVGVMITGGTGEVTNLGSISGALDGGVELFGGGTVRNSGSIFGTFAINIREGGSVINRGTLNGQVGISITGGGTVSNSGSIDGGVTVDVGTVTNDGTITCAASPLDPVDSVMLGPGDNERLVIDPGAVFNGPAVSVGREVNVIELAPGFGSVGGIGNGQFEGFRTLEVDAGASWTLTGVNKIPTVLDMGTLNVAGSLTVSGAIDPSSTGTFILEGGSSLEIAAALGTASAMSFLPGSELVIDNFGSFGVNVGLSTYAGSLLEDFGGATIDLKGFGLAGLSSSLSPSGVLQLTNSAAQLASLEFQTSSLGAGTFHFGTDGSGGVLVTHS